MSWFKRFKEGIQTATKLKRSIPDGIWIKCKGCGHTLTRKKLVANLYKCSKCNYHMRIGPVEYFEILFDGAYQTHFENTRSVDMLKFKDLKSYPERLEAAKGRTDSSEAIIVASGKLNKIPTVIAAMDFNFIGGSMGSVMGERISRAIDLCVAERMPLIIISKSGGARMMEAAFSLMQMAKTSAKLAMLHEAGIPYISYMTDPTTGGVTASFAMLGDINIAEPGALIAFAGPRVVKETIKKDLPEGFQTAEFLYEKGFLDLIVDRAEVKERLGQLLAILCAPMSQNDKTAGAIIESKEVPSPAEMAPVNQEEAT